MSCITVVEKIERAKDLINDAVKKHGDKVAISCSFGKDSIVVLHLARQIKKDIPVFAVLTRFQPKETFTYKDQMKKFWNLNLKEYSSDIEIASDLYKTNPDECCRLLKIEPTKEAVKNLDAWICGLRNTEGRTRKNYQAIEKKGLLYKYNPILDWTELDVWKYIALNKIPAHPWYGLGYRSLGCAPCTKLIPDEKLEREGRWQGTSKCGGECGIHTRLLKK